jgi:hypothetical protein
MPVASISAKAAAGFRPHTAAQSFAICRRTAQRKVRDVDVMFAHGLAQHYDNSGHVFVGGVDHMRPDFSVVLMPLIWIKRGFAITKDRASDRAFPLGRHDQPSCTVKRAGFIRADLDAAFWRSRAR